MYFPSLPHFSFPVGNKWPFCNCIPLSWFFTTYVCSVSVCIQVSTSLTKWIRESQGNSGKKNYKFLIHFFLVETMLLLITILFRIGSEVSHSYETHFGWRNLSRRACVTSEWGFKSQCAICHIPFPCHSDHTNMWISNLSSQILEWLMSRAPT